MLMKSQRKRALDKYISCSQALDVGVGGSRGGDVCRIISDFGGESVESELESSLMILKIQTNRNGQC